MPSITRCSETERFRILARISKDLFGSDTRWHESLKSQFNVPSSEFAHKMKHRGPRARTAIDQLHSRGTCSRQGCIRIALDWRPDCAQDDGSIRIPRFPRLVVWLVHLQRRHVDAKCRRELACSVVKRLGVFTRSRRIPAAITDHAFHSARRGPRRQA